MAIAFDVNRTSIPQGVKTVLDAFKTVALRAKLENKANNVSLFFYHLVLPCSFIEGVAERQFPTNELTLPGFLLFPPHHATEDFLFF